MRALSANACGSVHVVRGQQQTRVVLPSIPGLQDPRLHTAARSASTSSATTADSRSSSGPTVTTPPAAESAVASTSGSVDYFATDKRPVILYDGVCNLCNGGVNQLIELDTTGQYRLAALQSNPGRQLLARCGRAADDISSIVLVEQEGHYIQSDAVLRIASRLGGPIPLLAAAMFTVPKPIRDVVYDQVANNRYNFFGRTNACRCEAGMEGFQDRFLGA